MTSVSSLYLRPRLRTKALFRIQTPDNLAWLNSYASSVVAIHSPVRENANLLVGSEATDACNYRDRALVERKNIEKSGEVF